MGIHQDRRKEDCESKADPKTDFHFFADFRLESLATGSGQTANSDHGTLPPLAATRAGGAAQAK